MNTFDARTPEKWGKPQIDVWGKQETALSTPFPRPDFADDENLKVAFGIELGKGLDAFKAACSIFNDDLPKSLWASCHWANDPVAIASRDQYARVKKKLTPALDKEELLAEVLEGARSSAEDRDRIQFLKLYSEIAGFTGKIAIDASTTTNNNTSTLTKIVLVKGSQEPENIKAPVMNNQSKIQNSLPTLKLVGGLK